jgi:HAD superfamily PSPase-like hydrolase
VGLLKYRLVAFDLDGTLVVGKSGWWKLHEYFGTIELSLENMKDYEQRRITYDEWMRRDIALWKPRPHVTTLQKILLDYILAPHAEQVITALRDKKLEVAIVTNGLDIVANSVASKLCIPNIMANGLVLDENGYLTDRVIFNVDLFEKDKAFKRLIKKIGILESQCIAVGDSKYDKSFLLSAGLGIAYKKDSGLTNVADSTISDLNELLNFI